MSAPGSHSGSRRKGVALIAFAGVLVVGVLVALPSILGRRSGDELGSSGSRSAGRAPEGMRRVETEGFAMAVPTRWKAFPLSPDRVDKLLDGVRMDPDLEAMIRGLRSNGRLFAYDPDDEISNLNVIRQRVGRLSADGLIDDMTRALHDQLGATDVHGSLVELPAGPAARVAYVNHQEINGKRVDLPQVQYHVIVDGYDYVVTFSGNVVERDPAGLEVMAGSIEVDASLAPSGTQASLRHPADVEHLVELGF